MNSLIVYGSRYGTTKRYAEKLSEKTGIPAVSYKNIRDISEYKTIIHMGGLYAGSVTGLKNTLKAWSPDKKLVVVTVGLADVTDPQSVEHIRASVSRQIPRELYDSNALFHLRGGMDYQKLRLLHKVMISGLCQKIKSTPEEKQTAEDRAMFKILKQKTDFTDYDGLQPVIDLLEKS